MPSFRANYSFFYKTVVVHESKLMELPVTDPNIHGQCALGIPITKRLGGTEKTVEVKFETVVKEWNKCEYIQYHSAVRAASPTINTRKSDVVHWRKGHPEETCNVVFIGSLKKQKACFTDDDKGQLLDHLRALIITQDRGIKQHMQ